MINSDLCDQMYQIILGTFIVSLMHALIPSHWIPLLVISRTAKWTKSETVRITLVTGLAHVLSSFALGLLLGWIGFSLSINFEEVLVWAGPLLLIVIGLYFIYRHHTHHHFHVDDELTQPPIRKKQVVLSLMMFMILSPCMEIEVFFFAAGQYGLWYLLLVGLIYALITLSGMLIWIQIAWKGWERFNMHKIEHNAGLLTGWTIVATGILGFFLH